MLIAIEGLDASGKQTHTRLLVEHFRKQGREAASLAFPAYDTAVGKAILSNLKGQWALQGQDAPSNALILQALMTVNRYELADKISSMSLGEKVLVLDRYFLSGVVYGTVDGLNPDWLWKIHRSLPKPDKWFLLDIDPSESVQRRPERRDRYETNMSMMHQVRKLYLEHFNNVHNIRSWRVIDAGGTVQETHEKLVKSLT